MPKKDTSKKVKWYRTPPKYETAEALALKIEEYFQICQGEEGYWDRPPTMQGMQVHLGLASSTFRAQRKRGDDFRAVIDWSCSVLESFLAEQLITGGRNAAGIIFSLKHNFQWKDQVTHVHEMGDIEKRILAARQRANITTIEHDGGESVERDQVRLPQETSH